MDIHLKKLMVVSQMMATIINFTPDLPRMLKLACNGLGELETFLNSKSQEIEWKFTTLFPEEQSQFSLNLLYSFWQTHSISNKFNISAIMM